MLPSVRAFLSGIIDYAGLFPPAQLSLDEAIRRYARYRTEPESWMLGRFVCAAERLHELAAYGDNLFQQGEPFAFAVLLRSSEDALKDLKEWASGYRGLLDFGKLYGDRAVISAFEVRLSQAFWEEAVEIQHPEFVAYVANASLAEPKLIYPGIFFEYEVRPRVPTTLDAMIRFLGRQPHRRSGYKLRCGGLEAATFPPVDKVAHVITACRDAGMPLKFTAGLHHPIRHYDSGVQTHMHGFLNVFGAGVLAHARKLSEDQVREIIADEDASHFVFTADGFRWKDHFASVDAIAVARQQAVISFGSCSFDEPREDLRKLGLL